MRITRTLIVGTLLVFAGTGLRAEGPGHPAPAGDPRLEFLKSLEGTWIGEPHHEGAPPSLFEFRVTAGGHAVEEREMAGSPMEMLTVYHMDGTDLVATHYCMLGNQPKVVAAKRVEDNALRFDCAGTPGNETSHDAQHIHGWTIKVDGDKLHYQGAMLANGKLTESPDFKLTRQRKNARN